VRNFVPLFGKERRQGEIFGKILKNG